jgi:cytochrome c-type biogenesis protein CcmF
MSNPGQITMWLGLTAVVVSSVCYLLANGKNQNAGLRNAAKLSFVAFTAFVTIASLLLMHFILNHDFVYSYVARYSSRDLRLLYLFSSFWAGQEGSFLLWVVLGAWLGLFLIFRSGDKEPRIMFIYNLNNLFLMILLIKQSPFQMVPFPPADGNGLNMLLQDPWMAIHPPIVFLGYAAFTIPFAYAVSAMWDRDYDAWIKPALPWAVFAFVTLGAGIIIGGFWSYKVLGWGGYWGWDPVENASLLPWLAGTALVHGMILQHTKKKLRKTNFALAAFSFVLVIYCTFLTRSGVLADFSVHSFVDLGITGWLILFMAVFVFISVWLFATRARQIPASSKEDLSYFSREFGLIAAMILLCLSCLVTGLGTSAPLITKVMETASKVSNEFYVDTNLPLAILLLFLLGFVPLMPWGKNSISKLIPKLPWALVGAVIALVVTLWSGYPGIGVLVLSVLAGAVTGMNLVFAVRLMRKRLVISSAALVHLGVGLMFVGIVASSSYDRSEKVRFSEGVAGAALGYDITFTPPKFSKDGKGVRLHIPLDVKKGDDQFTAEPDIYSERTSNGETKRFVHPHIRRGLVSDLYISPVDFDPGTQEAARPNLLTIKKGQTVQRHAYAITFEAFEIPNMMGKSDLHEMTVGASIKASYKGGEPVTLKPILKVGQLPDRSGRVRLPGPEEAHLTLSSIDAGAKTISLIYEGPGADSAGTEDEQSEPNSVIAEVSVKPGMTVLWLGTFLMLFGGSVGVVRRWPGRAEPRES